MAFPAPPLAAKHIRSVTRKTELNLALSTIGNDPDKRLHASTPINLAVFRDNCYNYTASAAYTHVSKQVNASFCCVIDLGDENPLSYFWLGYCHSRGINAVPISRLSSIWKVKLKTEDVTTIDNARYLPTPPVLAFDIRALWYIDYEIEHPEALASSLKGIWEDLIVRDLTKLQRNIFWEKLTQVPTVAIFTGALHHVHYIREMVGDWDLRAVSKLMTFLSSDDVPARPILEMPVYAPKTIKKKLGDSEEPVSNDVFLRHYKKHLTTQLKGRNCIIIATAESNPLTELVLSYAYSISDTHCFQYKNDTSEQQIDRDRGLIIALKKAAPVDSSEENAESAEKETDNKNQRENNNSQEFNTYFCRNIPNNQGHYSEEKEKWRGFLVDGRHIFEKYTSQNSYLDKKEKFYILAHLLIMKNPLTAESTIADDTYIVVLNGLSGPATYALAELITGETGDNTDMDEDSAWVERQRKSELSEQIMKLINKKLKKIEEENRRGVEAILSVEIKPPKKPKKKSRRNNDTEMDEKENENEERTTENIREKSYDIRRVSSWELWPRKSSKAEGIEKNVYDGKYERRLGISGGNPRWIPIVADPDDE